MRELKVLKTTVIDWVKLALTTENEDYKNVLIYRYIKDMSLSEVATKLYISLSTAKRWHNQALNELVI